MATKRCIITLGVSEQPPANHPGLVRDFRPGIARLQASLVKAGYDGDFIFWENEYPGGSPTHRDSPGGFKPFCFSAVAAQGYESVLWLDATVTVLQPVDYLFQCIERDGYLIFAEDHSVGEYCKDEALAPLGITRQESWALPSCWTCTLGLDLRVARSRAFLQQWTALAVDGVTFPGPRWSGVRGFPLTASRDPRVKGHRYDQTAASVLAWRLGMNTWHPKGAFFQLLRNNRRSIPTSLPGAPGSAGAGGMTGSPAVDGNGRNSPMGSTPVLFFSRGRGRGHAVPDIAIAETFPRFCRQLAVQFVSYATGADTFRRAGWPVIDLGLPEANPFLATLLHAHALITDLKPAVVIAHEEYAVLPAARMAGVPCILLTDWFPAPQQTAGEAVASADAVVFLGEAGIFPPPAPLRHAPVYVGPVVRPMRYTRDDRPKARRELGLPESALVVAVIPGAWATEERAPIAGTVLPAFQQLAAPEKFLLWLTQTDHDRLVRQAGGHANIRVLRECAAVEQIMVASDVVITKGNRGTILDAASLGVPSLSLSFALNPVDETLVARIRSNRAFHAKATDATMLRAEIERLAAMPVAQRAQPLDWPLQGGAPAARALLGEIARLIRATGAVPPRIDATA